MTTVELKVSLPDELAKEAQEAGLLNARGVEAMVRDALRRRRVDSLFEAMDRMAALDGPALSMEEIQAEVEAVRRERRERAGRS